MFKLRGKKEKKIKKVKNEKKPNVHYAPTCRCGAVGAWEYCRCNT